MMSELSLKIYLPSHKLQNTDVRLKTKSGENIRPLCKVNVDISFNQQTTNQNLNVVLENGPNLFDRDCLTCLCLEWREKIHSESDSTCKSQVQEILEKPQIVFEPGIGKLKINFER